MAEEKDTIILEFQVDTKDAVASIENLTKANKELREERKKLDTSTSEGQARIKEINQQLDKNTDVIKNNVSALEKQKINIGNYSSALDKLVPGLGGVIDGIGSMTKASLTFIATPIGAIIAALGVAIAAVTSYFKSSEEAQNRWNRIVAVGSAIIEQLKNYLEDLGEAILNIGEPLKAIGDKLTYYFEHPKKLLEDLLDFLESQVVNRIKAFGVIWDGVINLDFEKVLNGVAQFETGLEGLATKAKNFAKTAANSIEESVKAGIDAGNILAKVQADIDLKERDLIVKRAETDSKVSQLRIKAITEEGDLKKKTIQEAINLETSLSNKEVELAGLRLLQAKLELQNNGADKEAKNKVAEATANLINAEALRYQNTLKFSKELEKLHDQEVKNNEKLVDDQNKQLENDQKIHDKNIELINNKVKATQDANDQIEQDAQEAQNFFNDIEQQKTDNEKKQSDYRYANYKKSKEDKKKLDQEEKAQEDKKLGDIALTNAKVAQLNQIAFGNNKELAAANAGVSMWVAASKDLEKGWPLGAILAAIDIATGLANIAHIEGIGFAQGGYTGSGNSSDVAGPVHKNEFVMPQAIVDKFGIDHFQSYLDGSIVANASSRSGGSQTPIKVDLVYKEFKEFSNKVEYKEKATSA